LPFSLRQQSCCATFSICHIFNLQNDRTQPSYGIHCFPKLIGSITGAQLEVINQNFKKRFEWELQVVFKLLTTQPEQLVVTISMLESFLTGEFQVMLGSTVLITHIVKLESSSDVEEYMGST
jgi:hypothetical protein